MVAHYSCHCLNIKLQIDNPSETLPKDGFQRLHLAEEGINVSLSHFTIRSRSYAGNGEQRTGYIDVTCLLCKLIAYRVQMDDPMGDGPEGPILATTTEWREAQPLNSKDGWLEVSLDCLSGDSYQQALAAPKYSPTFSLLLPSPPDTATASPVTLDPLVFKIPSLATSLPPLFLAPPFTPSHPVFQTFARQATKASDEIRKKAESEIETFIQHKLLEIGEAEAQLKQNVDALWTTWRQAWHDISQTKETPEIGRKSSGSVPRIASFVPSPPIAAASPSGRPSTTPSTSHRPPAVSLLSASLAQASSLHQHMQSTSNSSPSPNSISSPEAADLGLDSHQGVVMDSIVDGPYKRGTDESFAIAASFKLSLLEDAENAARIEAARLKAIEKQQKRKEEDAAKNERGRSGTNTRRVQFAEALKEEEEAEQRANDDDDGEPEIFEFDPANEDKQAQETSITPTASPKKYPAPLASSSNGDSASNIENKEPPAVEKQLMALVGADLPSHRHAWKKDRKSFNVFADSSNASDRDSLLDDDESLSDLSSDKSWKNTAQSLPINIGGMSRLKAMKEPKSSVVDKPGEVVPPLVRRRSSGRRVSTSEAMRDQIYAARDVSRSMDPGLAMEVDAIEEDDEDLDDALQESTIGLPREPSEPPADRSHKQALVILQKSVAPDAGHWRSLAE